MSSLLLAACGTSAKEDISSLPDDITDDSKTDSLNGPARGGTIRVGDLATGSFTRTRGWIGYELELTAGTVEVDLSATDETGGVLDTVVYVFGPKNETTGRYRREILALNDDAGPGDLRSHLSFDVPSDGHYRVVLSSYDNYFSWPANVSRGEYELTVSCPRLDFGACGPAVSPVGGICWADGECRAGAHCEGEITCPEGTMCLWVREGACVEDYEWLTYAPRQCLSNPWNAGGEGDGESPGYAVEELQLIDDHFESRGVDLLGLGLVQSVEPLVTCAACSCGRGDRLVVKARPNDVAALLDLGFAVLERGDVLMTFPKQCGSNPWEESPSPIDEGKSLAEWAAAQGAALAEVGFVYKTEAEVQCLACACARGDAALVFPADAAGASNLYAHGFGDLYVD